MRKISLFIVFITLTSLGFSQTGNDYVEENLSLSRAIELGLSNNYDITIVKKNVEAAENNNTQGQSGRFPTLSLNINQPNSASDQIKTASPFMLRYRSIMIIGKSAAINHTAWPP